MKESLGKIRIKNKSKFITVKQILECLKFLSKKHLSLDIDIVVFGTRWQFLVHWLPRFLVGRTDISFYECKEIFLDIREDGVAPNKGFHCDGKEHRIYIFAFLPLEDSIKENDIKTSMEIVKLDILLGIFHELHHEFQSVYHPILYMKSLAEYMDKDWFDIWIEKDAVKYSSYVAMKNKDKITKILEFENIVDWDFDGFLTKVEVLCVDE